MHKRLADNIFRPNIVAHLALPVNIVLLILLAQTLAQLTWQFLTPPEPIAVPGNSQTYSPDRQAKTAGNDYTSIAQWHLFGQIQLTKPIPKVIVKAPETQLNLRLAGVVYTEDESGPLALIAHDRGKEWLYRPGDQLGNKVHIEQIQPDRVILSRNGRLETLSLPTDSQSGSRQNSNNPGGRLIAADNPSNKSRPRVAHRKTVRAATVAQQFRATMATEPERINDLAFASPYTENGQVVGFHLKPGRNRSLLGKLGLRSGDILTEINGVSLNDPSQGLIILQELFTNDRVDAMVLRDGTEVPFTFLLTE